MENTTTFLNRIGGKRILITGGTTGIGRATVELLISLGARVLTCARDRDDCKKLTNDLKALYPECELYAIACDVSKEKDRARIFKAVDDKLGGIDVLINNAAIPAEGISKGEPKDWQYVLDTNVLGYLALSGLAVSRFSDQKCGHIINIGSMSAETREETGTVYVTTKSAIRGFTAALRKELNPIGIKVSLIEPGAVTSDMQPGSKKDHQKKIAKMEMLEAEDIAMSILFCLSQPQRCDIVSMQVRPFLQLI